MDAIQEFAVLSGNMAPEFGHTPNMIVASLKSVWSARTRGRTLVPLTGSLGASAVYDPVTPG